MWGAAWLVILLAAARLGEVQGIVFLRPRGLPPLRMADVAARPAGMGRDAAYLALAIDLGGEGLKWDLPGLVDALPRSRPVNLHPSDVGQLARRAALRSGAAGAGAASREGAAAAARALGGLLDAAECADAAAFGAAAASRRGGDESGGGRRCPKGMARLAIELKSGGAIDAAVEALGALEGQETEAEAEAAAPSSGPSREAAAAAARERAASRATLLLLLRAAVCRPSMAPERRRAAMLEAANTVLAASDPKSYGREVGSPQFDDSTLMATITRLPGVTVTEGAARAGAAWGAERAAGP